MEWSRDSVKHAVELDFHQFARLYPDASYDAWAKKRYNAIHGRLPSSQQVDVAPLPIKAALQPPMKIALTDALVLADLHVPFHDQVMLERAIHIAKKLNLCTLVIAGDLFNFDQVSRHPQNVPHIDINDELSMAGDVLRYLMGSFSRIYILSGNHDVRLARKIDRDLALGKVVDAALGKDRPECDLYVSDYSWMYLGDTWLIGHPDRYSAYGGKTPADIALVERRNVIGSHNHIIGMMQSKDGSFVGIDPGHMTDPSQHAYLVRAMPGQYAKWSAGFAAVVNDRPWVFNNLCTDWAFWIVED